MEKNYQIKNQLKEICTEESNSQCFDCGNKPANWASISNGIFLCLDCSGEHREFGINISFIKSVTLDQWTQEQVNIMKVGGNQRLKDFLIKHEMPENLDKKIIYNSNLLDFYRRQIKAESIGKFNMEPFPSKDKLWKTINLSEESLDKVDNDSKNEIIIDIDQYQHSKNKSEIFNDENNNDNFSENNEDRYASVGSEQNNIKNKLSSYMSWLPNTKYFENVKNIINNANEYASNNNDQVNNEISKQELRNNVLSLGNKTIGGMGYIGGKVIEKGIDLLKSDTMKNIYHKVGEGLWYLKDKIFGSTNNINNENTDEEGYTFIGADNHI